MLFDSREEVELKLVKDLNIWTVKICPIRNQRCTPICAAFFEGEIKETKLSDKSTKFMYLKPGCRNPMITGNIMVEM